MTSLTSNLTPYLGFTDTAREAMEFYRSVFGGKLEMMTFGEYGMEGAAADLVMHARLTSDDGLDLMGSDRPPGMPEVTHGDQQQLCLSGDDGERLHAWWDALAEGGEVHTPLAMQMWGDEYGDLTDRFGQRWMVDIGTGEGAGESAEPAAAQA